MGEWMRLQSQSNQNGQVPRRNDFAGPPRGYNQVSAQAREVCYYCGEDGHVQTECVHRLRHIKEGLIMVEGGGFRRPNSYLFPKLPPGVVKTAKERVEEYYADKKKEAVNSYELYEYPGGNEMDTVEPVYNTFTASRSGISREETPMSLAGWEEFQEYKAFMKAKMELQQGEGSSQSSF